MMQYYTLDDQHMLISSPHCLVVSLSEVESEEKPSFDFQETHALKYFPEAKSVVKKLLKEAKSERGEILSPHVIKNSCAKHLSDIEERERTEEFFITLLIALPLKKIDQKIKKYERMLLHTELGKDLSLEKAKETLITSLIDFNHAGFAHCLWHKEKTPSLKYYPKENKVYCFSCNKGGDAVDVIMAERGYTFREALKALGNCE